MSLQTIRRGIASGALLLLGWLTLGVAFQSAPLFAQEDPAHTEELTRKVKTKVPPVYPDIARRMNITGTVKMVVVVSPSGVVKNTKVVGGHPLLVTAATEALKKWKFEPASEESTGIVEFKFQPGN
ncbi:MAG: energy transducer TonB [Acidobacteriia bacterium]|nr:energy transducer TonB [Terriglobia bacterium]